MITLRIFVPIILFMTTIFANEGNSTKWMETADIYAGKAFNLIDSSLKYLINLAIKTEIWGYSLDIHCIIVISTLVLTTAIHFAIEYRSIYVNRKVCGAVMGALIIVSYNMVEAPRASIISIRGLKPVEPTMSADGERQLTN